MGRGSVWAAGVGSVGRVSVLETWNIQIPEAAVEPTKRWIRVRLGDTVVADSRDAKLLRWYGPGKLPTYCFPPDAVRTDLLEPATRVGRIPFLVRHDVHVGDERVADGALRFQDPPEPLTELDGWWTFAWDNGLTWYEEASIVEAHAKDTGHRVDVVPSERHIRIEIDGVEVADTHRPHALFETNLPTRWYLPLEDVHQELLVASDTSTVCPYKGHASYWSVKVGDELHRDVVWTYRDPIPEQPRIKDLVCFFDERVDVYIDGERQERPQTPWS